MAIQTAAAHVKTSPHTSHHVVILSDALSVLQALDFPRDKNLNDLVSTITSICQDHTVVLQWIPSHCNIRGNDMADTLAKEGSSKEQEDRSTTYQEERTIIKAKLQTKWLQQHPRFNRADSYYLLTRSEQVVIFRLRTGHNRLNHHMHTKFGIGQSDQCPCETGSMTTEHLLQSCPRHDDLRNQTWPKATSVARKLYGDLRDLRRTAAFVGATKLSI